MTVAELIEQLQTLPGDADLRHVVVLITVHRPYASDTRMECSINRVGIDRDVAQLDAFGYLE